MNGFKSDDDEANESDKNISGDIDNKKEPSSDNDNRLQKLEAQAKALRRTDSEDEDSSDDFSDDEEIQSPIDSVDPFIYFLQAIKGKYLSFHLNLNRSVLLSDPSFFLKPFLLS